ncbi:cbb3-type cytochrome oxidase assembly protein CcoS [Motiliproteus sp. MSK22-1]|uniref:cbb3-type cytochrome oxidase assembly protein CcoS n=1 Tax=Motiliproteus sp. MSK22-1 TaxID=1897630 RepID=UPI000977AAF3|nr:cbb3-type cytochrome oxidase assembly protein CcoS [Motiliproteus sp. MSK22-1]OMH38747.1 cytochrome oxidase maturation protein, cbb3-type [Motiliproteus sp. MSK22-1]
MEVIYGLIPGMIFLGVVGVAILFWAAKSGQFEDMEGEGHRILMDDDLSPDFDSQASTSASNAAGGQESKSGGDTKND